MTVRYIVRFPGGVVFQDIYTSCVQQVTGAIKAIANDASLLSNLHTIDIVGCSVISLNFRDARTKEYCSEPSEVVHQINQVYVCVPCTAGSYITGSGDCVKCPINMFQGSSRETYCTPCPRNSATVDNGKTSVFECLGMCAGNLMSTTGLPPCQECMGDSYRVNATYCMPCPVNTKFVGRSNPLYPECTNPSCTYTKIENTRSDSSTVANIGVTTATLDDCKTRCNEHSLFGGSECIGFSHYKTFSGCLLIVHEGNMVSNTQYDFYSRSCNYRTDEECFCGTQCPAGTFSFNGHYPDCRSCPIGYYTNQGGASECLECLQNETTVSESATSCTAGAPILCGQCRNSFGCTVDKHLPMCQCLPGYTGIYCENLIDYCASDPCYYFGFCTSSTNGFSCQCPTGTSGKRCEVNKPDCTTTTCLNVGVCEDNLNDFTCHCLPGHSGKNCEIQDPVCNVQPACENGVCVPINNVLRRCSCSPGYTGPTCAENMDDCATSPCYNGGMCIDGINTFICTACPEGYGGTLCDVRDRSCSNTNCGIGASQCVNDLLTGLSRCICQQGYSYGLFCQYQIQRSKMVTTGVMSTLSNIGLESCIAACESPSQRVKCIGFSYNVNNRNCQLLTESYVSAPSITSNIYMKMCSHPAADFWTPWYDLDKPDDFIEMENRNNLNNYNINICGGTTPLETECRIVGGAIFISPQCTLDGYSCSSSCPDVEVRYRCSVTRVFKDKSCVQQDLCAENCLNTQTCQTLGGEVVCKCPTGYTGSQCDVDIDECTTLNINCNTGTCIDTTGSYHCSCSGGYTGDRCQNAPVPCDSNSCNPNNTANCVNIDSTRFRCDCRPGFKGTGCDVAINNCDSNTCLHMIRCDNMISGYQCVCQPGWTGTRCETLIDRCQSPTVTCSGKGTCYPLFNDFYCQCNNKSSGKNCEITDEVCAKKTFCYNSGTCRYNDGSVGCNCQTGFMGLSCQTKEDYDCMTNSPCINGGTCSVDATGFKCSCPPGYDGLTCAIDIDECLLNPCSGAATCMNMINSVYCKCPSGKSSPGCTQNADLNYDLCFGKSQYEGMAKLAYPISLNHADGITVALWVKYDKIGSTGKFLSLHETQNLNDMTAKEIFSLDDRGLKLKQTIREVEVIYRDLQPNSGRWHAVVLMWRGSAVDVYIDSIRQGQIIDYSGSVLPSMLIWVSLGSAMFSGCVSQLNIYDRTLDLNTEVGRLFDSPNFISPSGVTAGWQDYMVAGDGRYVRPSGIDKQACPPGYTGFPTCATQIVDKLSPIIEDCPLNVFTTSINGVGQPIWAEPKFSGVSSVIFTERSSALLSKGAHTVLYEARDSNNNTALCHFKLYINDEFCPVLPAPQNNGQQSCHSVTGNWRFTACSINCQDTTFANNRIGPVLYTCSSEGNWIWPPSQDVYPPCGNIVGPAGAAINVEVKYPIGSTSCLSVQSTLTTKLAAVINTLNTQWNAEFCQQTSCTDVNFNINCNLGEATTVTFDLQDVKHDVNQNGESLTSQQILTRAIIDQNIFDFNDILNSVVDPHSVLINANRVCPAGQTVIDNECVTCTSGTYYDAVTMTCIDCPKGQHQSNVGQASCDDCQPGKTTEGTGSTNSNQCYDSCDVGNYFNMTLESCTPCGKGKYQNETGQFECTSCPIGQITLNEGSSSISLCVVACNPGNQLLPSGQCDPCPIGTYSNEQVCISCPGGLITENVGADDMAKCNVTACLIGSALNVGLNTCGLCPIGEYQDETWQTACKPCGTRFRTDTKGSTSPTDCKFFCASGYQANADNTDCEICLVGFYKDNAENIYSACNSCPPNFITPSNGTTSAALCTILQCNPGNKADATNSNCEPCPYGTYQPNVNQRNCLDCLVGQGTRRMGAVAQSECEVLCESGFERVTLMSVCTSCPIDKYRQKTDIPSNVCQQCLEGFVTSGVESKLSSECTVRNCTSGYKIDGSNCVECPIGEYQDLPYQESCKPCVTGKTTARNASTNKDDCIAFCVSGEELLVGTCTPCSQGFYKDNTINRLGSCVECPVDNTTPKVGSTSLTDCSLPNCTSGSKIDIINNVCEPCPINEYQPDKWKFSCIKCPDQSVTLDVGTVSQDQCIFSCFAGFESVNQVCTECGIGFYKPQPGTTLCTTCPTGSITKQIGTENSADCTVTACNPGNYLDEENNVCKPCYYRQYQPEKWQSSCLTCEAGTTTLQMATVEKSECVTDCSVGQEYNVETSQCEPCSIGYYRDKITDSQISCVLCPGNNITATSGTTTVNGCNVVNCTIPGQYRKVNQCQYCPVGKYQDVKWQTQCTDCPGGTTTKSTGTEAVDFCYGICPSGEEIIEQTNVCKKCAKGKYRDSRFTWTCQLCHLGFSTNGEGADSITECNIPICTPGTQMTGSECELCPIGTYQSLPVQTKCIQCPDNKITLARGSNSVRDCISLCENGRHNCTAPTTCTDVPGGFECQCRLPYYGNATNCPHACETNYCLNGATCRRDNIDICFCQDNYIGDRCDSRVGTQGGDVTTLLIGVVVGIICFLLLVIACIVCTITRRRKQARKPQEESYYQPSTSPPSMYNGSLSGSNGKAFLPQNDQLSYDPSFYSTGNK